MSSEDKQQLVGKILELADKLFRLLLPTVPQNLLNLDVTMPQLKIMLILYVNGPTRMSDIATGLEVALPTATGLIDRLIEKNYVYRETKSDDRRVVLCLLSEEGQHVIGQIWVTTRIRCEKILESLDDTRIQMLVEVLQTMVSAELKQVTDILLQRQSSFIEKNT